MYTSKFTTYDICLWYNITSNFIRDRHSEVEAFREYTFVPRILQSTRFSTWIFFRVVDWQIQLRRKSEFHGGRGGSKDDLFPSLLYGPLSGFRNPETALKVLKSDKANRDYESFPPLSLFLSLSFVLALSLSSSFCLARRCTVYDSTGFKIKSITDFVWLSFLFFSFLSFFSYPVPAATERWNGEIWVIPRDFDDRLCQMTRQLIILRIYI